MLFIAYLLSGAFLPILDSSRREYGNGLNKLEPNDINNSMIHDLGSTRESAKQEIIQGLERYLQLAKHGVPEEQILQRISIVFNDAFSSGG